MKLIVLIMWLSSLVGVAPEEINKTSLQILETEQYIDAVCPETVLCVLTSPMAWDPKKNELNVLAGVVENIEDPQGDPQLKFAFVRGLVYDVRLRVTYHNDMEKFKENIETETLFVNSVLEQLDKWLKTAQSS